MRHAPAPPMGWYRRHWKGVALTWGSFGLALLVGFAVIVRAGSARRHGSPEVEPSVSYPLETCVVSGKPLPERLHRVAVVHDGIEVQLCCPPCRPEFDRDPDRYVERVVAARR